MRRAVALACGALFLAAAAPASGHSVMKIEGGTIFYNATDDVALNTLGVSLTADNRIRFYDRGADNGITPPSECTPGELDASGNPREVFCPRGGVSLIRIDVGEGQDEVTADLAIPSLVVGGNGADRIVTGPQGDTVNGDEGNDDIRTGEGNDTAVGGGGDDAIATAGGDDVAQGALGADAIDTGAGNDDVRARDGVADQVLCGAGTDKGQADGGDRLVDCEAMEVAGTTTTGGGEPAGGSTTGGGTTTTPGTTSTRDDRTAPKLRAGGPTRQRLGRGGAVRVLATVGEAADIYATGYVEIGARRFALKRARGSVTVAGGGAELRVGLDRTSLSAARRALRRNRKVTVSISVLATDRAGNSVAARIPAIRLR